ncbi:MAG TPA: GNAT family N-acetyltransferase [Rhodopila sp.]
MIRSACADEADAVRDVVLAAYQHYVAVIGRPPAPMLDDYAARIADGQVWVLEEAAGLAGVLVLEDGPDCFLLENIAVRPDRQGSGLGRMLLDFAEAEAVRRGWSAVLLYTNALMARNIAIYTARGYVERERRSEKGFERVYMEKGVGEKQVGG